MCGIERDDSYLSPHSNLHLLQPPSQVQLRQCCNSQGTPHRIWKSRSLSSRSLFRSLISGLEPSGTVGFSFAALSVFRLRRAEAVSALWIPHWHSEPFESQGARAAKRSEEHTSELQSRLHLVCRLLLEKKKNARAGGSAGVRARAC